MRRYKKDFLVAANLKPGLLILSTGIGKEEIAKVIGNPDGRCGLLYGRVESGGRSDVTV